MTIIAPVIIFFLVALILGFLQFSPGLFSLFYHYALGKHGRTKADNLSLDYILGTETAAATLWFTLYVVFFAIFYYNPNLSFSIIPWILAGIIFIEAILVLLLYYRKGSFTALFVSRRVAKTVTNDAKKVKSRKDAFFLGFISTIPELFITLPLYILVVYILAYSTFLPNAITIIFFIIISTLQLFIIRTAYRTDHNLASIERFRKKTKLLVRLILSISLLLLAIVTVYLGVSYNG